MADSAAGSNLDAAIADSMAKLERIRTKSSVDTPSTLPSWWTTTDAMTVSTVVLLFGLVTMILASLLLRAGKDSDAVLRVFGTILILVATLFLIVAGYSSTQIAPAMGLLGTVAGYLLGKSSNKSGPKEKTSGDTVETTRGPAA